MAPLASKIDALGGLFGRGYVQGVTQTASVGAILGLPALGTVEGGGVSVEIHSPKFGKVPGPSRLSPFRVATT